MEKNVGYKDKLVRYGLAVVFGALGIQVSPFFWILSLLMFATAIFGTCFIYKVLKIDTTEKSE